MAKQKVGVDRGLVKRLVAEHGGLVAISVDGVVDDMVLEAVEMGLVLFTQWCDGLEGPEWEEPRSLSEASLFGDRVSFMVEFNSEDRTVVTRMVDFVKGKLIEAGVTCQIGGRKESVELQEAMDSGCAAVIGVIMTPQLLPPILGLRAQFIPVLVDWITSGSGEGVESVGIEVDLTPSDFPVDQLGAYLSKYRAGVRSVIVAAPAADGGHVVAVLDSSSLLLGWCGPKLPGPAGTFELVERLEAALRSDLAGVCYGYLDAVHEMDDTYSWRSSNSGSIYSIDRRSSPGELGDNVSTAQMTVCDAYLWQLLSPWHLERAPELATLCEPPSENGLRMLRCGTITDWTTSIDGRSAALAHARHVLDPLLVHDHDEFMSVVRRLRQVKIEFGWIDPDTLMPNIEYGSSDA